jgi:7,8-dihydro-6-hydroxymethylpterin-pyrophosphokinase
LIDVDLLLYGDVRLETVELTIPHRELWNRRFALLPLATVLDPGPLADHVAGRLAELGDAPTVRPHRL